MQGMIYRKLGERSLLETNWGVLFTLMVGFYATIYFRYLASGSLGPLFLYVSI